MTMKNRRRGAGIHLWVGFQGTTLDETLRSIIKECAVGGIVLFRRNVETPEQLKSLLDDVQHFARTTLGRPLQVAIDQEGGPVQRLIPPFTQLPSARELALAGPEAVVDWTTRGARELRSLGITVNLAPVLDMVDDPEEHFLGARSLGSDPSLVAILGRIWIETLQRNGVSATAKHFPGLGRAQLDPHHDAPVIRWPDGISMVVELLPFAEAVKAGVRCVMTSHARYPDLDPEWPATLSSAINRRWLREHLKFKGVLLSDDLDMAALCETRTWEEIARQGLLSGIDVFLLCQDVQHIEPFHRAVADALSHESAVRDAHLQSLGRLRRLSAAAGRSRGSGGQGASR